MSKPGKHRGRFGHANNSTEDERGDDYSVYYVTESDQAWCVTDDPFAGRNIWLPKSACSYGGPRPAVGHVIEIWVPDWLAESKGLV
jgi:hypothetical protein